MSDAVQRWRVIHRREATTTELGQRSELGAWEAAFAAGGLPVAVDGRGRARLGGGIPLPVGLTAEAERIDVLLAERWTAGAVRRAVVEAAPAGHPIVDVYDVWLGEPPLVAVIVAADYRLTIDPVDETELRRATTELLAADRLERTRSKGGTSRSYDLRPLLIDARAGQASVWLRLRADPTGGVGRPDEALAEIGDRLGRSLTMIAGVRERLWLTDELGEVGDRPG